MTRYHWPTIRAQAIIQFNDEMPKLETENEILETFEQYPAIVVRTINDVAEALAQGKARSGWAVVKARLQDARRQAPQITVDGEERERAVKQAERYIVHAGAHYDRWETELHDELFGDRGSLRDWSTDTNLTSRLEQLWQQQRPRALAAEERQDADAAKHRGHRATLEAHREQLRQEGERTSSEAIQRIIDTAATTPTDDEAF